MGRKFHQNKEEIKVLWQDHRWQPRPTNISLHSLNMLKRNGILATNVCTPIIHEVTSGR